MASNGKGKRGIVKTSQDEDSSKRLAVTKICVIGKEESLLKYALVTVYGWGKGERHISSLTISSKDEIDKVQGVSRFVFVTGSGNRFVMPDTRLELNYDAFWEGRLDAYVSRVYVPGSYRLGKIENRSDVVFIASAQRIGVVESNDMFTLLNREELRNHDSNRNRRMVDGEPKKRRDGLDKDVGKGDDVPQTSGSSRSRGNKKGAKQRVNAHEAKKISLEAESKLTLSPAVSTTALSPNVIIKSMTGRVGSTTANPESIGCDESETENEDPFSEDDYLFMVHENADVENGAVSHTLQEIYTSEDMYFPVKPADLKGFVSAEGLTWSPISGLFEFNSRDWFNTIEDEEISAIRYSKSKKQWFISNPFIPSSSINVLPTKEGSRMVLLKPS